MNSWTYYGVTIDPAPVNGAGIRWCALVSLPTYAGYLRADSKAGMRELIRHYSPLTTAANQRQMGVSGSA